MRVAVVNWTSRHAGGIETYVGCVSAALAAERHDVFFIHEGDTPADRPAIDGMERFPAVSVSGAGLAEALRTIGGWRPDVMFVQRINDPGVEQALLAVAPSVFFAHDYLGLCISGSRTHQGRQDRVCHEHFDARCLARFFPYRCGGRSPLTMWKDYRRQTARLDRLHGYHDIACFSEYMRDLYLQHGFDTERVHRVPPIDTARQVPTAASVAHSSECRLLFLGRIERLKGCHVLIDALATVAERLGKGVTLEIAGSGPDEPRCREHAARAMSTSNRVTVKFLGWLSPEQSGSLLRHSDAMVVPSLWPEPLGLAGLEALRAGVPVTAFAVGGIPEWLEDGVTGTLAPADPPSAAALADAIVRCVSSTAIREGARAHAQMKDSTAAHVRGLAAIFERATGVS